jgi:hypothetical protein
MSYLEDELAEKCLSQTLFPKTKIIVGRKTLEQKRKEKLSLELKNLKITSDEYANVIEKNRTEYLSEYSQYDETCTYTNELHIEIDFSEVDPKFLENSNSEKKLKDKKQKSANKLSISGIPILPDRIKGLVQSTSSLSNSSLPNSSLPNSSLPNSSLPNSESTISIPEKRRVGPIGTLRRIFGLESAAAKDIRLKQKAESKIVKDNKKKRIDKKKKKKSKD